MQVITFHREVIRFPDVGRLPRLEVDALEHAAASAFKCWQASAPANTAFLDWLRGSPERTLLEHRLSRHWMARRVLQFGSVRPARDSLQDLILSTKFGDQIASALVSGTDLQFCHCLERSCSFITNGRVDSFRRAGAWLEADSDGTTVKFCPWEDVEPAVVRMRHEIESSSLPPAVRAVAALACMLNIHPFEDGNGRTARLLFNSMMRAHFGNGATLPLRGIIDFSAGGFELSMREAEVNGDWAQLLRYFRQVFELVSSFTNLNSGMATREGPYADD